MKLVLAPGRVAINYWRDLWRYRELMYMLAWRDITVRYKQTVLGISWVVVQPLVTVGIFTFVFGTLAGMASGDPRYALVVMSGVLAWQLFATALSSASGSLVANAHLLTKVYFPRLIVPLSSLAVSVVDFVVVLGLYVVMAVFFSQPVTLRCLLLPAFMLLAIGIALGSGLWMSALMVRYRDFRHIVPFLLQVGLFLSPIGFRTDVVPNWQFLLALNPMTGVIDGFRWCLLGIGEFYWRGLFTSVFAAVVLLASGLWYFRRTERNLADLI